MTKGFTEKDRIILMKVAYLLWFARDAINFKPKFKERLEALSEEVGLLRGIKWIDTGLIKDNDGKIIDNDCEVTVSYDDAEVTVVFETNDGFTATSSFEIPEELGYIK
ncbi:hypothetical protein QP094_07380 [Lactobacillus jensenii]|uniref:hypothetical protein n=1 Tax=Lactobacillus jensenii TaxID=109790 RepID=UPI002242F9E0|nr:hypothetical protein [Lactobacillus jensenii]MCW8081993.1 hypothetical protein [Lactobacillus jensenii]MDK6205312.1 hypothetical protein [Lactobacillus jensenii]